MSFEKLAELLLTPGILIFVFFMFNKRIDDLSKRLDDLSQDVRDVRRVLLEHITNGHGGKNE